MANKKNADSETVGRSMYAVNKKDYGIYQIDSDNYEVRISRRIRENGNKRGEQYHKRKRKIRTLTEARVVRDKFVTELNIKEEEIIHGNMLWKDVVKKFYEYKFNFTDGMSENDLSHYFKTQKWCIEKHTKNWNEVRIKELTHSFVVQDLKKKFEKLKISSEKSNLKYIRHVFDFHRRNFPRCLAENPLTDVKPFHKIVGKGTIEDEIDEMNYDQFQKMKFYFRNDDSYYSKVFTWALNSGMRSGEIYGVRFSDIKTNEEDPYIKLVHSYCFSTKKLKEPKSGDWRRVPINKTLMSLIEKLKQEANSEYVFNRCKEWEHGKLASELRKIQKEKLKIPTTSFHTLRAFFIVDMLVRGVGQMEVRKIVDHKNSKTMDIYIEKAKSIVPSERSTDVLDEVENPRKRIKAI